MRARDRIVRRIEAAPRRRHELADVGDRPHLLGARPGDGDASRRPLLEQELGRLDHRLGVEAGAHRPVVEGVGDRDQRHALVVRHVGPHDRDRLVLGQTRRGVVERLVPAETAAARPRRRDAAKFRTAACGSTIAASAVA